MTDAPKPITRSEREAKLKDKAGFVISIFAFPCFQYLYCQRIEWNNFNKYYQG